MAIRTNGWPLLLHHRNALADSHCVRCAFGKPGRQVSFLAMLMAVFADGIHQNRVRGQREKHRVFQTIAILIELFAALITPASGGGLRALPDSVLAAALVGGISQDDHAASPVEHLEISPRMLSAVHTRTPGLSRTPAG